MINVYELYKAFKFRTLWEGNDPLVNFQRLASESAYGTGHLNGIVQLTDVLRNMEETETKAVRCFTNNVYTTNIKTWRFDKTKDVDVSLWTKFKRQELYLVFGVFVSHMSGLRKHFGCLPILYPDLKSSH